MSSAQYNQSLACWHSRAGEMGAGSPTLLEALRCSPVPSLLLLCQLVGSLAQATSMVGSRQGQVTSSYL